MINIVWISASESNTITLNNWGYKETRECNCQQDLTLQINSGGSTKLGRYIYFFRLTNTILGLFDLFPWVDRTVFTWPVSAKILLLQTDNKSKRTRGTVNNKNGKWSPTVQVLTIWFSLNSIISMALSHLWLRAEYGRWDNIRRKFAKA